MARGCPVCTPARSRRRYPSVGTVASCSRAATAVSKASCGVGKTAITPSPSRLTTRPRRASIGGSTATATSRNTCRACSSPARSAQGEKPTRSVNSNVTSRSPRPRPARSASDCHSCSTPNPASRDARGCSSKSRSAMRATAEAPSAPATESGSPNRGRRASPVGSARAGSRFSGDGPRLEYPAQSEPLRWAGCLLVAPQQETYPIRRRGRERFFGRELALPGDIVAW